MGTVAAGQKKLDENTMFEADVTRCELGQFDECLPVVSSKLTMQKFEKQL